MELIENNSDTMASIKLKGRFDAYEVNPVINWIKQRIDTGQAQLVVNLEGVNFIDSTALSALVQGLKRCREKDGDLLLCCLQQPVRVIFELTRLDKAFEIFATQEEALVSFH
jgi:anti-sigma B factor antagonist